MDGGFIDWGVQSPILRLVPEFLSFPLQDDGRKCFWHGEQSSDTADSRNDQSYPGSPSPSQVALRYELSHDRACDWTEESCTCEGSCGDSSIQDVPEISVCSSYDGDGSCAEAACEEATYHYRFDVLCYGHGNLEYGEDRKADEEGPCAAIYL